MPAQPAFPRSDRRQVDERLERGASLAPRQRHAVELAHLVVAPTHEGADFSGGGIECDQGSLKARTRFAAPEAGGAALELVETAGDRVFCEALQRQVERGDDPRSRDEALFHFPADVVGEIGRRLARPRAGERAHRLLAGALVGGPVQHLEVAHPRQDDVPPLVRALGIEHRRIRIGRAYHAREERGLARRELVHLFRVVGAARRAHAADGERATLAEVDLVQVGLEDLLLRVAPFDEDGQPRLAQLARHRPLRRQQAVLDELLGDRAPALGHLAGAGIDPHRPREALEVEGPVLEEPVVLDGEHRVEQSLGRVGKLDRPIVFPRLIGTARQNLALERRLRVLAIPRHAHDALAAQLEPHARPLLAEEEVPHATRAAVLSGRGRLRSRLGVPETGEDSREINGPNARPGREGLTGGVDDHRAPCLGTLEPRELDSRVGDERHRREQQACCESEADNDELPPAESAHHA